MTGIETSNLNVQNLITAHRSGSIDKSSNVHNKSERIVTNVEKNRKHFFTDVLNSKIEGIRFSTHAQTRIKNRKIEMTSQIINKLEKAVSDVAVKGAKDSLVLMDNLAFIVNIPNRTVITAMDGENLRENIFTNIDSAVIAD